MRGTNRHLTLAALCVGLAFAHDASGREPRRAPEFPTQDPLRWIGTPTRLADLRGRVVLLDVWTFG